MPGLKSDRRKTPKLRNKREKYVWIFFYALGAAILYGLHQIFTKMAGDQFSDGLGRFVVEGTAGGSTARGQMTAEDEKSSSAASKSPSNFVLPLEYARTVLTHGKLRGAHPLKPTATGK